MKQVAPMTVITRETATLRPSRFATRPGETEAGAEENAGATAAVGAGVVTGMGAGGGTGADAAAGYSASSHRRQDVDPAVLSAPQLGQNIADPLPPTQ